VEDCQLRAGGNKCGRGGRSLDVQAPIALAALQIDDMFHVEHVVMAIRSR
jgi:hypothetical protein